MATLLQEYREARYWQADSGLAEIGGSEHSVAVHAASVECSERDLAQSLEGAAALLTSAERSHVGVMCSLGLFALVSEAPDARGRCADQAVHPLTPPDGVARGEPLHTCMNHHACTKSQPRWRSAGL